MVELDAYTFSVPRACWLAHQTRAKQVECTRCYASLKTAGAFFDRNHVLVCHNPSDNIFWGGGWGPFSGVSITASTWRMRAAMVRSYSSGSNVLEVSGWWITCEYFFHQAKIIGNSFNFWDELVQSLSRCWIEGCFFAFLWHFLVLTLGWWTGSKPSLLTVPARPAYKMVHSITHASNVWCTYILFFHPDLAFGLGEVSTCHVKSSVVCYQGYSSCIEA